MLDVAALYIDPRGPYPSLPGVDCWDAKRDALGYEGTGPVIAHPPCGPWGPLRRNYKGGDGERVHGRFSVSVVQHCGGVLEQPAQSTLWDACGLPYPEYGFVPDKHGGFSLEVNQSDWGHVCRKPTWLYVVTKVKARLVSGMHPLELELRREAFRQRTGRKPTHWIGGSRTNPLGAIPEGIKVASAEIRRRTPIEFAQWLVSIARRCRE